MNQQPDKLFRDKLERYQKAAPAGAWDRINAGVAKKNDRHTLRWLSIAASLLLLAAAVFLLSRDQKGIDYTAPPTAQRETSLPETSARKETEQPKVVQEHESKAPAEQNEVAPSQQHIPKQKEEKKKVITPSEAPAEQITVVQAEEEQKIIRTPEQPEVITEPSVEEQHPVVTSATPAAAQPDKQNIKLVFSAEESEGYLDKKALAEATSSDKKPSTLKKLLKKAEDLATNQDPFGELRQKKNEILALSFKTDKQRGQNK